jgi:hypothetical protein
MPLLGLVPGDGVVEPANVRDLGAHLFFPSPARLA